MQNEQFSSVEIRAMFINELAQAYGVSVQTMRRWLKKMPADFQRKKGTYFFTPKQIKAIFDHLGVP